MLLYHFNGLVAHCSNSIKSRIRGLFVPYNANQTKLNTFKPKVPLHQNILPNMYNDTINFGQS